MEGKTKRQIGFSAVPQLPSTSSIGAFLVRLLLVLAIPILLGGLLQACGGGGGGAAPSNIKSITIDPINPSIATGTTVQLHATANFKNKTTKDITESVTWVSADTNVAHISNAPGIRGLASGLGAGATSVKVKFKGKTG